MPGTLQHCLPGRQLHLRQIATDSYSLSHRTTCQTYRHGLASRREPGVSCAEAIPFHIMAKIDVMGRDTEGCGHVVSLDALMLM